MERLISPKDTCSFSVVGSRSSSVDKGKGEPSKSATPSLSQRSTSAMAASDRESSEAPSLTTPKTPKQSPSIRRWNVFRKNSGSSSENWSLKRGFSSPIQPLDSGRIFGYSPPPGPVESPETKKRKNDELYRLLDEVSELYNGAQYADVEFDKIPKREINFLTPSPLKKKTFRRLTDAPAPLRIQSSTRTLLKKPPPLSSPVGKKPQSREFERLDSLVRTCSTFLNWPITPSQITPLTPEEGGGLRRPDSPTLPSSVYVPQLLPNFASSSLKTRRQARTEAAKFPRRLHGPEGNQTEGPEAEQTKEEEDTSELARFIRNTSPQDAFLQTLKRPLKRESRGSGRQVSFDSNTSRNKEVSPLEPLKATRQSSWATVDTSTSQYPESKDHNDSATAITGLIEDFHMAPRKSARAKQPIKKATKDDSDTEVDQPVPKSKKTQDKAFTEEKLFSAKSRLGTADLNAYFQRPEAWDCLTDEEKGTIRSLLPNFTPFDDNGRPHLEFLKYNNDWRHGVRQFQEDLRAGRYDPDWQEEAAQAVVERANGEYDDWKEEQFEEYWGQKQKLNLRQFGSEMNKVLLEELIAQNVFEVGDIWYYSRLFGRGKSAFMVDKAVIIIGVCTDNRLVFSIPSDPVKTQSPQKNLPPLPSVPESPHSEPPTTRSKGSQGTNMTIQDPFNVHTGVEWRPEVETTGSAGEPSGLVTRSQANKSQVRPGSRGHERKSSAGSNHSGSRPGSNSGASWVPPKRESGFTELPIVTSSPSLSSLAAVIGNYPPPPAPPIEEHPAYKNKPDCSPGKHSRSPSRSASPMRTTSPVRKPVGSPPKQASPLRNDETIKVESHPPRSRRGSQSSAKSAALSDRPPSSSGGGGGNRPQGPRPFGGALNNKISRHERTPSTEPQTHSIGTLQELEKRILDLDGRTEQKKAMGGTEVLWKSFTATRYVVDHPQSGVQTEKVLGTLWDVRKKYWLGKNPYVRVPKIEDVQTTSPVKGVKRDCKGSEKSSTSEPPANCLSTALDEEDPVDLISTGQ